ncbi:hypothetical protein [Sorangium atrum]|uniref:Uncharacterized protein n=1 Tax=Sorangium atrum TaxID=2995308 RepID=A0ABT5CEP7_9BACT|nr:hypothetical protein [Sorangium aterium]MDC0684254.1 hypothetical protein [Sorangium aterium]
MARGAVRARLEGAMNWGGLLVLALLARVISEAAARKAAPSAPPRPPMLGLGHWNTVVVIVLVPIAFALASGQLWCALPLAPLAVLMAPWPFARHVIIPLGLPRAAYCVAWLSDWTFRADRRGGAALAAAWALCRARKPDAAVEAWVSERIERGGERIGAGPAPSPTSPSAVPLRGAGIAAGAMLAAHRGDVEGARALFDSVASLDERACPREARRIAAGWLAAEAASRGDWAAVSAHACVRGGRALSLLGAVAARLLGEEPAPGALELWLRWLIAPHRRATLPLVRRALAAGAGAPRPEPEAPEPCAAKVAEGDLWSRAVLLHAALLLRPRGQVSGDDLRRLGGAWDAALDDERAQAELRERAASLGASGAQAALGPLARAVEEDLAATLRAARVPREAWDDLGATIGRTHRRLRDELLSEVEIACDALRRRVDERRELPPLSEWREWTSLRAQYEAAAVLVGTEFRRLAFPKLHADVCHAAVWLFNTRKERAIANGMFRWLLAEAEALGDSRLTGLQRGNVECGV